jgi:ABC-type sugar transport system permease subunit
MASTSSTPAAGTRPQTHNKHPTYLARERRLAWLLIVPSFVVVFALVLVPIVRAGWMSLHSINLKRPAAGQPFVGLENYADIFRDPSFWQSTGRTLYFLVVSIGVEIVIGVAVAVLLNQQFRGRGLLRAIVLIPWALPITVDAMMWLWILNPNYGALNSLLWQLGLIEEYRTWLSSPWTAMNMVILADVWKVTPLVILLTLAALQTIPPTLYEAARVDGAGAWRSFWGITIPLLRPTLAIVLVIRSMDAFRVFDIIYIMTSGGPSDGTKVIAYYTYLEAFSFLRMGRASALAYLMTIVIILMAMLYVRLVNRETEY